MTLAARADHANEASEIAEFLAIQLADCETHWSLGTFGALAEFTRGADEPVAMERSADEMSAVTTRGGIRIAPPADLRLFASESATRTSWSHRVSLCLPENQYAMNQRHVLTELGPDKEALRTQDRPAVLFDLGLDTLQVDACVRVADPKVANDLRALCGRSLFEHGNPGMSMILAANPHRVFQSRLGRIEVFAPIPPPNGKSPEGPHTHVLPKLLQAKRTHAATEPVPQGYVPCAHLYPAHAMKDALGHARAYDAERHDNFQDILRRFGDPNAIALKQSVVRAIEQGAHPAELRVSNDRFARAGVRVALRQMLAAQCSAPALPIWIAHHDRTQSAEIDDSESETHGHHAHAEVSNASP